MSEKPAVPEPLEKEPLEGKKTEVKNNPPEKDVKIEKASEKEPEIKKESETEKTKVREERRSENVQTESKLKKIKYTFQKLCGTIKKAGVQQCEHTQGHPGNPASRNCSWHHRQKLYHVWQTG